MLRIAVQEAQEAIVPVPKLDVLVKAWECIAAPWWGRAIWARLAVQDVGSPVNHDDQGCEHNNDSQQAEGYLANKFEILLLFESKEHFVEHEVGNEQGVHDACGSRECAHAPAESGG